MKKKIFTLLVSSFLLSGAFSNVNAQHPLGDGLVDGVGGYSFVGTVNSTSVAYGFSGCTDGVKFTLKDTSWDPSTYQIIANRGDKLAIFCNGVLHNERTLVKEDLEELVKNGSITVAFKGLIPTGSVIHIEYTGGLNTQKTADVPFALYDYPTVTTDLDEQAIYDYYYGRTTQFPGKVQITRTGGSPDLLYSIDGVHPSAFEGTTVNLTEVEIQNLIPGSKILWKEPNSTCTGWQSLIDVPEHQSVAGGVISRPIYIGPVKNATVIPGTSGAGMTQFVPSGKNFVFKIQPTGPNEGLKPEVTTAETRYLPEGVEGITLRESEPGVWTVTVLGVQQSLNVNISFPVETESATGAAAVEDDSVWGADGAAYISSAAAGSAAIYSTAGALVKTVAYPAGTTSIPLPAGFYIISLSNGENGKVAVK
jgi:hypothetical protein